MRATLMRLLTMALLLGAFEAHAQNTRDLPYRGLRVRDDGVLVMNGRPYRAVGVNYFDMFRRHIMDESDTSFNGGLMELHRHNVPFARFMACGFWAIEWELYLTDKEEYFRRFDEVVAAAERWNIGLIPSLFWANWTVPDVVGEPRNRLGDLDSATTAFIRQYTTEVVTRYLDSPAIWAWEYGNEYNLAADLPNADTHRPPVWPQLGTPEYRTEEDDLTHDMLVTAFTDFAQTVRAIDPHRPITHGNSMPRPSAEHQRHELTWTQDSPEQFQTNLRDISPDPIDLISVHYYPESAGNRFDLGEPPPMSYLLELCVEAGRQDGKAIFLGEFGVSRNAADGNQVAIREMFEETLTTIEESEVALSAVWVYDFPSHDLTHNITAHNDRAYMLRAIGELNERIGPPKMPVSTAGVAVAVALAGLVAARRR